MKASPIYRENLAMILRAGYPLAKANRWASILTRRVKARYKASYLKQVNDMLRNG